MKKRSAFEVMLLLSAITFSLAAIATMCMLLSPEREDGLITAKIMALSFIWMLLMFVLNMLYKTK